MKHIKSDTLTVKTFPIISSDIFLSEKALVILFLFTDLTIFNNS